MSIIIIRDLCVLFIFFQLTECQFIVPDILQPFLSEEQPFLSEEIQLFVKPGAIFSVNYTILIQGVALSETQRIRLSHESDVYSPRNATLDFLNGYPSSQSVNLLKNYDNVLGLSIRSATRSGDYFSFVASFVAPILEGTIKPVYRLEYLASDSTEFIAFGPTLSFLTVHIACSDGIFCNGMERLTGGRCVSVNKSPCDSFDPKIPCASFVCNEALKRCDPSLLPSSRSQCEGTCDKGLKNCKPSCSGKSCGSDGCGGSCGICNLNAGESCVYGVCSIINQPGSCGNPTPLFGSSSMVPVEGIYNYFVYGDSSKGLDVITPICNTPGIPETVYSFEIPWNVVISGMGFEIRLTCADGTNGCDTLLAVHDKNCNPFTLTAVDVLCSDDQTPPGNVGSRVDGKLYPGNYTLVVTGYASSTVGPFRLQVKFTPGCYPVCEGKFCGPDGCGGSCGECVSSSITPVCDTISGRCRQQFCIPDCKARQCGPDGCGGTCGSCKSSKTCDEVEGECVPIKNCDSFIPNCQNQASESGSKNKFCGSDCQWHGVWEAIPDLVPNIYSEMRPSITFTVKDVSSTSCALQEGCISAPGKRLLMTFDTFVHNTGNGDFIGPNIFKNPQLFEWAACHQHYHFEKFARFNLYDVPGKVLKIPGAKLSYCMEDTVQYMYGPTILCDPQHDCLDQGIPRGRSDLYPGTLDCQWLDITDLEEKGCWFTYEVCTNVGRTIFESDFENNCVKFPIYIPRMDLNSAESKTYDRVLIEDNPMSFYPGCKE